MKRILTKTKKIKRQSIILLFLFIFGFLLRTYNINWDSGFYFHPDERAIVMKVVELRMPNSINEFFSPQSPLNPQFFAYGNFPMYLLKVISEIAAFINPGYKTYESIFIVGRNISALFDSLSIILVFLIARKLFSRKIALLSSFFYSISVLPIQLSHFFAVDTLLTTFILASLLFCIKFYEEQNIKNGILLGLFVGLSLATKISSLIILPILFFVLGFIIIKGGKKNALKIMLPSLLGILITITTFFLTQPYVFIDWNNFLTQTTLQSQMSKNPFIFPYTLQYVGKIPYVHELIQIVFFGEGLLLGLCAITGFISAILLLLNRKTKNRVSISIITIYFLLYFLVFGSFAVGWMRYMLPIYPILAIFAAIFISNFVDPSKKRVLFIIIVGAFLIYPVSFISIYNGENPRVTASNWIHANIPKGSTIATEHWDDGLPIYGAHEYTIHSLPLYDPDTTEKWSSINMMLRSTDYIIIASNRLYVPLQKLTDCKKLPHDKCYPLTASYYKALFSGKRGFQKVAEFSKYPTVPLLGIRINDQIAEENFTVFDHPKIYIFAKIK